MRHIVDDACRDGSVGNSDFSLPSPPPPTTTSNMQFAIPAIANSSQETQRANNYPNIRLFSVGQKTSSKTPLTNLGSIQEAWSVASNNTVNDGNGFGIFSAVCWIFGRELFDGLGGAVPIGLVSSNWGGTPVRFRCLLSLAFARTPTPLRYN